MAVAGVVDYDNDFRGVCNLLFQLFPKECLRYGIRSRRFWMRVCMHDAILIAGYGRSRVEI